MKTCLLLLLPLLACTVQPAEPCAAESARLASANQAVRVATEESTAAHAVDRASAAAEKAHAAVIAALTEQAVARAALTTCTAR